MPEIEPRVNTIVGRDGMDFTTKVNGPLANTLDLELLDREDAIAGIARGLESSAHGRIRPASEVFAEMRSKLKAAM